MLLMGVPGRDNTLQDKLLHCVPGQGSQHKFHDSLGKFKNRTRNEVAFLLELISSGAIDPAKSNFNYGNMRFPLGSRGAPRTSKAMFKYLLNNLHANCFVWSIVTYDMLKGITTTFPDLIEGCSPCVMVNGATMDHERLFFGERVPSVRDMACLRGVKKHGTAPFLSVDDFFDQHGEAIESIYERSHLCGTFKRNTTRPKHWQGVYLICALHMEYSTAFINMMRLYCFGHFRAAPGKLYLGCKCPATFPGADSRMVCLEVWDAPTEEECSAIQPKMSALPEEKGHRLGLDVDLDNLPQVQAFSESKIVSRDSYTSSVNLPAPSTPTATNNPVGWNKVTASGNGRGFDYHQGPGQSNPMHDAIDGVDSAIKDDRRLPIMHKGREKTIICTKVYTVAHKHNRFGLGMEFCTMRGRVVVIKNNTEVVEPTMGDVVLEMDGYELPFPFNMKENDLKSYIPSKNVFSVTYAKSEDLAARIKGVLRLEGTMLRGVSGIHGTGDRVTVLSASYGCYEVVRCPSDGNCLWHSLADYYEDANALKKFCDKCNHMGITGDGTWQSPETAIAFNQMMNVSTVVYTAEEGKESDDIRTWERDGKLEVVQGGGKAYVGVCGGSDRVCHLKYHGGHYEYLRPSEHGSYRGSTKSVAHLSLPTADLQPNVAKEYAKWLTEHGVSATAGEEVVSRNGTAQTILLAEDDAGAIVCPKMEDISDARKVFKGARLFEYTDGNQG